MLHKILKIALIVLGLSILGVFFATIGRSSHNKIEYKKALIGDHEIYLEIADTPATQYQGLSNQTSVCDHCGMLFIFPSKASRVFVMRQMKFPLDMLWLDGDTVIGYLQNLQPEAGEPYTHYSTPATADRVIELPAGFVAEHSAEHVLTIGTVIKYE